MNNPITVEIFITAPIEKIWSCWTEPEHITKWTFASDDWHAPRATNDLRVGGTFSTRMESVDGTKGFDMGGTYTEVEKYKKIAYTFGDRKATVEFVPQDGGYKIVETFEPEHENSIEMQKSGWQAIMDNFKKYVLSV